MEKYINLICIVIIGILLGLIILTAKNQKLPISIYNDEHWGNCKDWTINFDNKNMLAEFELTYPDKGTISYVVDVKRVNYHKVKND